jgi:hypothetical protein
VAGPPERNTVNNQTAAQPPAHWSEALQGAFWTAVNAPTYEESTAATLAFAQLLTAPADRAALRDRIAEALYERERPPRDPHWPKAFAADREVFEAMADAVLAVLPSTVDRAAVLRKAADFFRGLHATGTTITAQEAEAELRRMADEAGAWCKCRSCWGWFVNDHPGEDLDELGKDLSWWSGLPVHRDAPADAAQPAQPQTGEAAS